MINTLSKGRMLSSVKDKLSLFMVPKLLLISCEKWKKDPNSYLLSLQNFFEERVIIVRSSAADEDGQVYSSAGEYDSVLNIPLGNSEKITTAINTVISSYERKRPLLVEDEVVIQEMVQNTTMSGVIFTHDLNTGAPYYVINYDDQSGLTDTVTSGEGEYSNRTLYIHRNSTNALRSDRFTRLLLAVQELEQVMESQFLDIEFALGDDLAPYLLQVRTITTQPNWNRAVAKRIDATLCGVQSFVTERFKKITGVYGQTTVLGQMPDWNPVEMIGRAPRALATSLYQALITDHAWRIARSTMGYMVPTGQPLMVKLAGQPFIDTRLSFHSYLPKGLSTEVAEKLVNRWISHLKSSPELHDKVEFEVAITTYSFDIDEKIERLIGDVLTGTEKEEFKQAHLKQTRRLIKGKSDGSLSQALDKINALDSIHTEASSSNLQHNLSSLFTMVDDCIQLGTVPFSILARHGFIARTILLSLKRRGVITNDEVNQIQASVQTVASELVDDMYSMQIGAMSNGEFMTIYGHLRPGTYDIMSLRYDQMTNLIDGSIMSHKPEQHFELFEFSQKQKQQINRFLAEDGFADFNADNLLNYINDATVGREYGKFVFTRSVSDLLELIATFAEQNGLSRDEISHVPLNMLLNIVINSSEGGVEERLRSISEKESEKHDISVAIRLPQLLTDQAGVHVIPFQVSHPNFITHKKVTAPCLRLDSEIDGVVLSGKVVIIEGADPGFDWIFSQNIAGLVTKYGGINSHMAIRCAEFGIPAAIGCGEQRFELLLKSNQVHLDCASGLINSLH
jgi:glutamine kinase